ncbi:hypothetical protein BN381_160017 [Candidatus Microthrix parvicella RN1]|uniref:Uncharacterized protein n=1 Tax=Candidatus Neomicrothrix parvicella RN1 TaxID=1229780 RepID=R4Z383_9ACTN|nr:hypothetical protein BN381_160017 [Candidatus Microthrix parvicella RN1]
MAVHGGTKGAGPGSARAHGS